MKHKIIFLLIAVILMNGNLIGSNEPVLINIEEKELLEASMNIEISGAIKLYSVSKEDIELIDTEIITCLLYTSPSPRDGLLSRMPSSA